MKDYTVVFVLYDTKQMRTYDVKGSSAAFAYARALSLDYDDYPSNNFMNADDENKAFHVIEGKTTSTFG